LVTIVFPSLQSCCGCGSGAKLMHPNKKIAKAAIKISRYLLDIGVI
jgi:hypothetical protein